MGKAPDRGSDRDDTGEGEEAYADPLVCTSNPRAIGQLGAGCEDPEKCESDGSDEGVDYENDLSGGGERSRRSVWLEWGLEGNGWFGRGQEIRQCGHGGAVGSGSERRVCILILPRPTAPYHTHHMHLSPAVAAPRLIGLNWPL
eukprot:CAMPEP_0181195994 /NCGR_PEP_ID=MMETSP1096-20121128/15202_1 /TAXON_ID=156174 ORGANISM="Chrysochromulina ericina, Strain CCMP281" /NCGR_SAMPLE_ID=MMETSP1096 /ASSEMBLY_ACC=CAM_ASM_000453 /LENGTH=143 /DNA_ID=CAMNT_0023285671 /DNA_START=91 /DNA_END=522 /DNA_ORIENTATION=-